MEKDPDFIEDLQIRGGHPDGSRGAVQLPGSIPTGHRANDGQHYSFGSTSELTEAPDWLRKGREKALARLIGEGALEETQLIRMPSALHAKTGASMASIVGPEKVEVEHRRRFGPKQRLRDTELSE